MSEESESEVAEAGVGSPGLPQDVSFLEVLPLHSTDLLTLLGARGVVRYESPSIERLYGYEQDELVGEQVAKYFHPEDRQRVMEAFEAIVESDDHRVEAVEYRHLMADGSYTWIESVASSEPTPDGHYVVNSRDVSDRIERKRTLERAREQVAAERDGKEAIRHLLVESSSDEDIADSVCSLLVDSYGCDAAWVVQPDRGDAISGDQVLADRGEDGRFREAVDDDIDPVTGRTLSTGETESVRAADATEPLASVLRGSGLHSVQSEPLVHDGVSYGALTVVRSESGTELSQQLVDELAAALAFKRQVHRQRRALTAETVAELSLTITTGHPLASLSRALTGNVDIRAEKLHGETDGGTYLLETSGVDAGGVRQAAANLDAVREATIVTETRVTAVLRLRVDSPTLGTVLERHGGVLQSTTVRDGTVEATVQFPRRTDLSAVTGAIRDHWPDATVRFHDSRSVDPERPTAFDDLTRKQENALRAASLAGFFERPQVSSAEDIADSLDVSASTFLYHLRTAEARVFGNAFGRAPGRDPP